MYYNYTELIQFMWAKLWWNLKNCFLFTQLTVEDYVHIMEILTNDVRFTIYNVCYKRVLVVWIFTAFVVLLGLLFSGLTGLTLFGLGVLWLVLNAAAIFFCMWIKVRVSKTVWIFYIFQLFLIYFKKYKIYT